MNNYTLGQVLDGIKKRDNVILTSVYKEYFPLVRMYIIRNRGNEEDAKDVFQEALIVIYKSLDEGNLNINTSFKNYLLGTCRLIWLKILRNRNIHNKNVEQIRNTESEEFPSDTLIEEETEARLFRKHFKNLSETCQSVIQLSINGVATSKIAEKLGYKNEKIVRNKKAKCKEYLVKLIKDDPEYKSLQE